MAFSERVGRRKFTFYVVTMILSGAALRGFLLFNTLRFYEIENHLGLKFRLQTSISNIGLALILATLSVGFISTHAESTNSLIRDQRRLLELRKTAVDQLAQFDEGLKKLIAEALTKSISDFSVSTSSKALQLLRTSIDEVVRPLSNYLDKQAVALVEPDYRESQYKISWRSVFSRSANLEMISPFSILFSLVIFGGAALLNDLPVELALLEIASVVLLGWVLFKVTTSVFKLIASRTPKRLEPIWLFLSLYIPGQFLGVESVFVIRNTENPRQFLYLIPVFSVLLGYLYAVLKSARIEAKEIRESMLEVSNELRWGLARARELNRQQKRLLTFTLHGQIQAAMEAAFIRLQLAVENGQDTELLRGELWALITNAVDLLFRSYKDPEDLQSVLWKIESTWEGITQINWNIPGEIFSKIKKDHVCHTSLIDLVTELVFNAVKHGKPETVNIDIHMASSRSVLLEVTNNGSINEEGAGFGLGTKLLEESAISWDRSFDKMKITTTVLIPYAY
jgi:hypothetical protein